MQETYEDGGAGKGEELGLLIAMESCTFGGELKIILPVH